MLGSMLSWRIVIFKDDRCYRLPADIDASDRSIRDNGHGHGNAIWYE